MYFIFRSKSTPIKIVSKLWVKYFCFFDRSFLEKNTLTKIGFLFMVIST